MEVQVQSQRERAQGGWHMGFLASVFGGTLAALTTPSPSGTWLLAITGLSSLLMPLSSLVRAVPPPQAWLGWLGLTVGNASLLLSLLGIVLFQKTHHRPLGGATFAVVAALILILMGALAARAVSLNQRKPAASARPLLFRLITLSAVLSPAVVIAFALGAGAPAWSELVQAVLVVIAAALGMGLPARFPAWLVNAWSGPALWLCLLALGALAVGARPEQLNPLSPLVRGLLVLFQ